MTAYSAAGSGGGKAGSGTALGGTAIGAAVVVWGCKSFLFYLAWWYMDFSLINHILCMSLKCCKRSWPSIKVVYLPVRLDPACLLRHLGHPHPCKKCLLCSEERAPRPWRSPPWIAEHHPGRRLKSRRNHLWYRWAGMKGPGRQFAQGL